MSRFEEVKARILNLLLSETLQKLLSVVSHELGCQFDSLRLTIGQLWMVYLEQVFGWRRYLPLGLLSFLGNTIDLFS